MNKYTGEVRKRSQNLLIVEGNHEKNELFWLLFKCFPEINIDQINKIMGMDITFVTTANTDAEALELLKQFGLPFKNQNTNNNG